MGDVDWPMHQKSFGPSDRDDITSHFMVANLNGQREFVARRKERETTVFWRVTADGRILNTAVLVAGKSYGSVSNDLHRDLYERTIGGLLEILPPSPALHR